MLAQVGVEGLAATESALKELTHSPAIDLQRSVNAIISSLHPSDSIISVDDQSRLHQNLSESHFICDFLYCLLPIVKRSYFTAGQKSSA